MHEYIVLQKKKSIKNNMTLNLDILSFPVLVILRYNFFIFNIEKKISYVKACTKKGQLIENKIKNTFQTRGKSKVDLTTVAVWLYLG